MSDLLDWLGSVVLTALGESVTVVELIGFAAGALCIVGVTRRSLWGWAASILNALVTGLALVGVELYVDAALQAVFALLGVYGWVAWRRGMRGAGARSIRRASARQLAYGVVFTAIGTVIVAYLLTTETDAAVPWATAFALAASLLATWAQARKIFEHWWVWIAANAALLALYAASGLWVAAALLAVLLLLRVRGLVVWTRALRASRTAERADGVREVESESVPV
jgi:nicotinamide mononucleotide transporter